jgi:branched-chain amino acid transport system permease protein
MVLSYFRRAYSSFAAHVFDIPPRFMVLLFLVLLSIIPLTGLGTYYLNIVVSANLLAIFAVSWDLLVGRTGQISLGHALFFGIGGYTTAFLFKFYGFSIWFTIPAAIATGGLISLLVGFPALRVKGPYLALVTMAFPLIIQNFLDWPPLTPIFGGRIGILNLPAFFPLLSATQQIVAHYYLTLLLLLMSSVIIYKIANSKTGIVFVSILDDETASKACGINITKYKLLAFTISGLFASLAGSLQAHILKFANPPMFSLTWSFVPIIVTFLGGIGTIYGPIVGAYIYYILDRYVLTIFLPELFELFGTDVSGQLEFTKLLIFALIVLILVIKWPRGVAKYTTDKLEDLEEARDLDERGPRIWKRYPKKDT